MYRISFYVPVSSAETVKNAMFDAGAGTIGHYTRCSWESLGRGQFKPGAGSRPAIGELGYLEQVDELKVEIACDKEYLKSAIEALIEAHPFEEPAYGFWRIGVLSDL